MDAKTKQIATDLSYEIIREVSRAIRPYVGKPESGEKIKMGADGTPTSLIDIIAEDKLVNILKNAPVLSYLISEEIGELKLGRGTKRSINLTQELKRTDLKEEYQFRYDVIKEYAPSMMSADEIRALAEQTKDSTENISSILDELSNDTELVSEKINETVEISNEQVEYIEITRDKFSIIHDGFDKLNSNVDEVNRNVNELKDNNNKIVEEVTNLSATTEEISANCENASNNSSSTVSVVNNFVDLMDKIANKVYELDKNN